MAGLRVTFGTAKRDLGALRPRSVPNFIYVRPSHVRCRWTNNLVFVRICVSRTCKLAVFVVHTEDVSFWSVLGTLSALEAFFATMRYINWHWHLHSYYSMWHYNYLCLLKGWYVGNQRNLPTAVHHRIIQYTTGCHCGLCLAERTCRMTRRINVTLVNTSTPACSTVFKWLIVGRRLLRWTVAVTASST